MEFSVGDKLAVITTDPFMGNPSAIHVKQIAEDDSQQTSDSVLTIKGPQGRINRAVWGPLNKTIISGGDDSVLRIWDSETGKILMEADKESGHQKTITSLSKSADGSHFLTGSLDKTAKLWDARTLTLLKTYATERPVNAVAISPLLDHVVIGGGQEASHVTTTDRRAGKFEAKFFHKILQEEIGGVKDHFGLINALVFNPDGRSFSSGGEEGYVWLHHFDPRLFQHQDVTLSHNPSDLLSKHLVNIFPLNFELRPFLQVSENADDILYRFCSSKRTSEKLSLVMNFTLENSCILY